MHHARLSHRLQETLDVVRNEFEAFTNNFSALTVRRDAFAPVFMKAYRQYHQATGRTFIAFVQELDKTVPAARAEYPKHRSYRAALYLRRLDEAPETTTAHRKTMAPFDVLAAVIKGFLPLVPAKQAAEVWTAVARTSHWRERDILRLQARVTKVRPVELPTAPRLVRQSAAS